MKKKDGGSRLVGDVLGTVIPDLDTCHAYSHELCPFARK